jgi:hypothetical protein
LKRAPRCQKWTVAEDRSFVDIDDQLGSKQARDVTERIFGKACRPIPQLVTDQIFDDDLGKSPNAILTDFFDVVVSGFEFPPALLLCALGDGFGC